MSLSDRARQCRRLAREIAGDPMESALLKLAQEYESGQIQIAPGQVERRNLRVVAENWLRRAEHTPHSALQEAYKLIADSYSKLAAV